LAGTAGVPCCWTVSFPEIRPTYKKMELEGNGEFAVDDRSPDLELCSIIWILSSWALTSSLEGAEVACGTLLMMEPCSPLRTVGRPDDLDELEELCDLLHCT
jgi:hypothetical protein